MDRRRRGGEVQNKSALRLARRAGAPFLFLLVAVFQVLAGAAWAQGETGSTFQGRVVAVPEGDSLRVQIGGGWTVNVPLHGVECPRLSPQFLNKARAYTRLRVLNTDVRVQVRGTAAKATVYGEVLTADNKSLNEELIRVGLATWAKKYAPQRTDLKGLEEKARFNATGFWGDPTGTSVPLPPDMSRLLREKAERDAAARKPTPTPAPPVGFLLTTATPTPTPVPTPRKAAPPVKVILKPSPATVPPVSEAASEINALSPDDADKPLTARVSFLLMVAFVLVSVGAFVLVQKHAQSPPVLLPLLPASPVGPVVARLAFAAAVGLSVTLLLPFPLLLIKGLWRPTSATLVAGFAAPLLLLCSYYSGKLTRREQILRATPLLDTNQYDAVQTQAGRGGLVKVRGKSRVAPAQIVQSGVGNIPGLYLEEATWRYEAVPGSSGRAKRKTAYRWVETRRETQTADFYLQNEAESTGKPTGETVRVAVGQAEFHPLRIARFYNEVPVETWFDQPYSGDTRTEIRFIPPVSTLTVWGRISRETASGFTGTTAASARIGYDAPHQCLVIVEGDEARLWSSRPVFGLLLTLVGIGLAILIAYCVLTPGAFSR